VRGLSELLYLYKRLRKPSKPKLEAIPRSFSCPAYPAVPRGINRFSNLHYGGKALPRQRLNAGDLFEISVGTEWVATGQLLEAIPQALNSVGVALWKPRRADFKAGSAPSDAPFSILLVTPELLKKGEWRIFKSAMISIPIHARPYEAFRAVHWVGAKIVGAGIVEEFLQASVGLCPWDDWADPLYLDSLLAPGQLRPSSVVLKHTS